MVKIAAVVVLYYPQIATIKNILSYSSDVDIVYAIDNSETSLEEFEKEISKIPNCVYIKYNDNQGVAKRLNEACELAREKGYQWILTMDQDSSFSPGEFKKYLGCFENYPWKNVAIFSLNFMPEIWVVKDEPIEVLSTITSGSLVNLSLNKIIGMYSEALFIDLIDAEYCYRAHALNYKIVSFRNIILNHRLGYIQQGRSLKTFKLTPRILHNPIRIYYIVRNSLYMLYKYKDLPVEARSEIRDTLFLLKNNLLYHKKRLLVIRNIILGFWDYKRNKMGKYNY